MAPGLRGEPSRAAIEPRTTEEFKVTHSTIHRLVAVLNMPTHIEDEIKYGQTIEAAMTNNPNFPNPNPLLLAMTTALGKYDATATAAKTRAKGTIPVRNSARNDWVVAMHAVRGQVQSAADANPDDAEAIITSSGMSVKRTAVRQPRTFGARQLPVSGSVELLTKSVARRAAYDWQYSVDAGKTWQDAGSTLQARTVITGLPPGTTVLFRFRVLTKTGKSDWSVPTSLLVK